MAQNSISLQRVVFDECLDSLQTSLPPKRLQADLCLDVFGLDQLEEHERLSEFAIFFENYSRKLDQLSIPSINNGSRKIDCFAAKSHRDISQIYKLLSTNQDSKRVTIRNLLRNQHPFSCNDNAAIDMSMDLAVRLWLSVNVHHDSWNIHEIRRSPIRWEDDLSLNGFLAGLFPRSETILSAKEARLSPSFTAAYLVKTCGLKIDWTDHLQDHLKLDHESQTLQVFADQAFLYSHLKSTSCDETLPQVYPPGLLEETIRSLNLLFPQYDKTTQRLLQSEGRQFIRFLPYAPRRSLLGFDYWRDRLLELHEEVYLAPPRNLRQIWADHRRPEAWYYFWIGVVILVLSFIQTIASLVQTISK